jgi:hypothetical protein
VLSAKRVRLRLIEETPALEDDIKSHKKELDEVIAAAFHIVRAELEAADSPAPEEAVATKRKRSPDADLPATSQPVPLKSKPKPKVMTDEELARRLDAEMNAAPSRTTRNGRTSTRKASVKSTKASKKKGGVKSAKYVLESGEEDNSAGSDDDEASASASDAKPRKRRKKAESDDESGDGTPKKGSGFNKPWALSDEMARVCGEDQLSRPQV